GPPSPGSGAPRWRSASTRSGTRTHGPPSATTGPGPRWTGTRRTWSRQPSPSPVSRARLEDVRRGVAGRHDGPADRYGQQQEEPDDEEDQQRDDADPVAGRHLVHQAEHQRPQPARALVRDRVE